MSWNECLYRYHRARGGQFLAGREDDGLLILTWKSLPLTVDLHLEAGRYGTIPYPRARLPVALNKSYKLTVGAEGKLSAGVNTVLKAVPGLSGLSILPSDFGFPEVTRKRLIRSDNIPFTKLVLGSLELRNALLACPKDKLEVLPGPEDNLHTVLVTSTASLTSTAQDSLEQGWYLGTSGSYTELYGTEEEKLQLARRVEEDFFPRMDRFLDLARAAYNAVTQWPV